MMNKKLICLIIFCFFGLNALALSVNSVEVYDGGATDKLTDSSHNIVMDNNGDYYIVFHNNVDGDIELYSSTDKGVTWSFLKDLDASSLNSNNIDMCITGNDEIFVIVSNSLGSDDHINGYKYNINSDTVTKYASLDIDVGHTYVFDEVSCTVDAYDNVYFVYFNDDDNDISLRKYTDSLGFFGSEIELADVDDAQGLSCDMDGEGYLYVSYINQTGSDSNLSLIKYKTSISTEIIRSLNSTDLQDYTDLLVDDHADISIVYSYEVLGDVQVNYTKGNFGGLWVDEFIYNYTGQDMLDPHISYSSDGVYHIVWLGINDAVPNNAVFGVRGEYNDWSELVYYMYSGTDSMVNPSLFYQNFPSNLNPLTGIIGVCMNVSDYDLQFFDYGIMLSDDVIDEYDGCENDYFEIIQWSSNEIDINVTAEFEIVKSGWSLARYQIINLDTDTVVQTDGGLGFNEDRLTVYYKPLWSHGLGNYSFDVKYYADSEWNLECPFTVVDGGVSLDSNWSIWTDKSTYTVDSSADVFVIVPLDEIYDLVLYRIGFDTPVPVASNLLGSGLTQSYLNQISFGTGNVDYRLKLVNETGIVKNETIFNVLPSGYIPDDEGEWYGLPFWVPYLIGVFITLFITMSPLIIGTYITRNSRIEKINIPPLLYVGFFFFGLVISVVMDFLPSWLPFVILFAMIVYFSVTWLAGRQSSVQGE